MSALKTNALPAFQPLLLPSLVEAPPEGEGWLHESAFAPL
jgi:hypothetical protein